MKITSWNQPIRVLAAVSLMTVGVSATTIPAATTAAAEPTSPAIAQSPAAAGSIIGQCRAATKSTPIYQAASTTSAVVRLLDANAKVTLASNGSGGFISVSTPAQGFVQAANLKLCEGTTTPPTTTGTCRRVVQPLGLVIRRDPSTTSAAVGGVDFNQRVDLSTNPATSKLGEGRVWVQLAKPASGWVSNGFQNTGGANLVYCQ